MTEKRKKDIRLVVSDIDGTLIRRGEGFPKEVEQAAAELKKRGILFTFASGRLPYMITPFAESLGIEIPVCACNGTLIYRKDEILENHPLRLLELRPLIETALLREMTVLYSLNGTEYCMRENEAVRRKQAERGSYHPIRPVREEEWESLWADKVNISDEQGEISSLLEWEQPLEGSCEITHYGNQGLEIVRAGFGKIYGVRQICAGLGISMEQVLAIGDNENDNEMLTQAGIGAAVGNTEAATKACADLTARKESGAGAAEIIRRICFEENEK